MSCRAAEILHGHVVRTDDVGGEHRLHRVAREQCGEEFQGAVTLVGFFRVGRARAGREGVDPAPDLLTRDDPEKPLHIQPECGNLSRIPWLHGKHQVKVPQMRTARRRGSLTFDLRSDTLAEGLAASRFAVARRALSALAALGMSLAGCSLSPAITKASLDYNSTVEDTTNTSLVLNILRARDSAPLYFSDISQIRGSLSAGASAQATFPLGEYFPGSTTRASLQAGALSANTNPTFDIAPTNTKDFYEGLLSPVSKDLFSYFVESRRTASFEWLFHLVVISLDRYGPSGIPSF